MKNLIKRISPTFIKRLYRDYSVMQYRKRISNKNVKDVFNYIHDNRLWGNEETRSGGGSTNEQTTEIKFLLPRLFEKHAITSVLDLPCGDFNWMQHVDLYGIQYIGADIVEQLIETNKKNFANTNRSFKLLNIIEDHLPKVDLILVRDCFVHLSNVQIAKSLENIKSSGIRYLLVTSFVEVNINEDIMTGEWRGVNMEREPFNLKSMDTLDEKCQVGDGRFSDKSLILVDLHRN